MTIKYGSYKHEAKEASKLATVRLDMIRNILAAVGIKETGDTSKDVMTAIAVIRNMRNSLNTLASDAGIPLMQQVNEE